MSRCWGNTPHPPHITGYHVTEECPGIPEPPSAEAIIAALLAEHADCGWVNPDSEGPWRWTCGVVVPRPAEHEGYVDVNRAHVAAALVAAGVGVVVPTDAETRPGYMLSFDAEAGELTRRETRVQDCPLCGPPCVVEAPTRAAREEKP